MKLLFVLSAALAVVFCSPVYVSHDFDRDVDFSRFHTYSWYGDVHPEQKEALAAQLGNPLAAKRMVAAVEDQLRAKGLEKVGADPDLLVRIFTGSEMVTDINRTSYTPTMGGTTARTYEAGTLIIDLVQADTNHLVWRGTAEGTLSEYPTPEEVDKTVRKAVEKIFEGYPPR